MTHPMPWSHQPDPEEWEHDLRPDFLAGINDGLEGSHREQDVQLTADEIESPRDRLPECSGEEFIQIPVMSVGSRLEQGAAYLDLAAPLCSEFTATAGMEAGPDHLYVPKSEVPHQIWNRLIGGGEPKAPDAVKTPDVGGGP